MSLNTMQEFFSNYCVPYSNSGYTYIYPSYEEAENKLNGGKMCIKVY